MFWHLLVVECFNHGRHLLSTRLEQDYFSQVSTMVRQRFSVLSRELRARCQTLANPYLNKLVKKEVILLPLWFAQSLELNAIEFPFNFLVKLGTANLFGWMAYGVYDNFLDNTGDPVFLPAANVCFGEVSAIYNRLLPNDKNFIRQFSGIMDRVEVANYWELLNTKIPFCDGVLTIPNKLPDFSIVKNLSDRSLGHALGPVAILSYLGYEINKPEIQNVLQFFEHCLAARQLGDDAHDWWEDLSRGRLNSASVKLCRDWPRTKINLNLDEDDLRRLFWSHVIPEIITEVSTHIAACRQILGSISIIKNPKYFLGMVSDLETMIERTKLQRQGILKSMI